MATATMGRKTWPPDQEEIDAALRPAAVQLELGWDLVADEEAETPAIGAVEEANTQLTLARLKLTAAKAQVNAARRAVVLAQRHLDLVQLQRWRAIGMPSELAP